MHPGDHPTFLSDEDLRRELSTARRETDALLTAVREFTVFAQSHPWRHLDDLLADLRAAAITVATLEQLVARS